MYPLRVGLTVPQADAGVPQRDRRSPGQQQVVGRAGSRRVHPKPPFTYGALVNNAWSYAGDEDAPDVNQLLLQPFINYNLPNGWSIGTAPIITANWQADADDRWTLRSAAASAS